MLYLVIETVPNWSAFLLSISQMMTLVRSLVTSTIWGISARCMFKFDSEYFFHAALKFFWIFFWKLEQRSSPHPSGNELTSSTNTLEPILHRNGIYIDMITTTINLPPFDHPPCIQQLNTTYPRWLPTATYTISSIIQKYYFLSNHNKSSITAASYEIFSNPLTTNARVWTEGSRGSLTHK